MLVQLDYYMAATWTFHSRAILSTIGRTLRSFGAAAATATPNLNMLSMSSPAHIASRHQRSLIYSPSPYTPRRLRGWCLLQVTISHAPRSSFFLSYRNYHRPFPLLPSYSDFIPQFMVRNLRWALLISR